MSKKGVREIRISWQELEEALKKTDHSILSSEYISNITLVKPKQLVVTIDRVAPLPPPAAADKS